MGVLRRFLVIFIIMLKAIYAQFLEQSDPGTVFVPVQDQVTLTCSVEEGYVVDWHVAFSNGEEADTSNDITIMFLMQRNFSLEGVATNRSTLSLWETETHTNNGTNITCLASTNFYTEEICGNTTAVFFYDAPPSPTDLNVTENELGSLNISWSLGFIEGVLVNYTLTVFNLNTTSAQPIIIAGLLDQYYVFETSRLCDVYSFTVTAVTAAGNSTPSVEMTFTRNYRSEPCSATTSDPTTKVMSTDTEVLYYIVGATTGAAIATSLIIILMILYCYCRQKMRRKKSVAEEEFDHHFSSDLKKTRLNSVKVHHPETEDASDQFYGIYAQLSADIAQHPPFSTDDSSEAVETSTLYAPVDIKQEVSIADDSEKEVMLYAKVDESKSKEVPSAEAMYAVVNKCKTKSGESIATCAEDDSKVDPLYSQVNKSRRGKIKEKVLTVDSSQSKALYAEVNKSKNKLNVSTDDCSKGQEEVNALYAQVDKNKKRNKADSSQLPQALHTEVNKTKTENLNEEAGVDSLYSQVNKSKMKKMSMTKEVKKETYAQVDKCKGRKITSYTSTSYIIEENGHTQAVIMTTAFCLSTNHPTTTT